MTENDPMTSSQQMAGGQAPAERCKVYQAYRCSATIGPDRRLVLDVPEDLPIGKAEVLILTDEREMAVESADRAAPSLDALLSSRPPSLTPAHAQACLPAYEVDPEWQAKNDAGELPEGIEGIAGSIRSVWPQEKLTETEARWILAMREHLSWRGLSGFILGDDNQIDGMNLEEAARRVLRIFRPQ